MNATPPTPGPYPGSHAHTLSGSTGSAGPYQPQQPYPYQPPPAPQKKRTKAWLWIGGLLGAFVVLAVAMTPAQDEPATTAASSSTPTATAAASGSSTSTPSAKAVKTTAVEKKTAEGTLAQQQALRAARSYLRAMPFSERGLVHQLSSDAGDGYSLAEAKWAVAHLGNVDWSEQAVRAGRSYLDSMPFSRSGLIHQLSSDAGSQFTRAQAAYAADKLGL